MKSCRKCDQPISEERLEVLSDTELCVGCARSNTVRRVGFMVFGGGGGNGKTGGSLVMLDTSDKESLRRAVRANRRAR